MRFAPALKISDRPYRAAFLAAGYDTLEESASVFIFEATWDRLEKAKAYAKELNNGKNQAYSVTLGGMEFQIKPHGGDGVAFILSNDLYTVAIRPASVDFNLSVTYRAYTLWHFGAVEARRKIWGVLMQEMKPRATTKNSPDKEPIWQKISRADFAFDFYSPDFSLEISPDIASRMVCHSSVKARVDFKTSDNEDCYVMGTSQKTQTLTIGKKDSLQIQIYDKSAEITEKSRKTWMHALWDRSGNAPSDYQNIWRIEVRFCREFLNSRNIDSFEDFEYHREALLSEALSTRRLTDRTEDSNRRRWPVHPMWGQALTLSGQKQEMRPIGRHTERAGEVVAAEAVRDMISAIGRWSVLKVGDFDRGSVENLLRDVLDNLEGDDGFEQKIEEYAERYKFINCPG